MRWGATKHLKMGLDRALETALCVIALQGQEDVQKIIIQLHLLCMYDLLILYVQYYCSFPSNV